MKYLAIFCTCILSIFQPTLAQDEVNIYSEEITIPTYMVDPPDEIPHFYAGRAYQGAQGRVYPYAYDGNLTDEKKDVSYNGLFLENEFLKICVLPELGGRLYYMIDKTNGYNVIYRNNVIKPSMIGMLGAWISGGVEWNVPHHHRASTFMNTDYELVENEDGSKTIWVGELEIRHQVRWMIGLTLFPNNANLKVDIKYINQTPQEQAFLIWANTAVHTNENYQVIYPPKTEYATFHRKVDFTKWPISNEHYQGTQFNGEDISYWKNAPNGGSFFAWEDQGHFVAGIDHGENAGLCVVGDPNVVIGKKLWTWGTQSRADMWEKILTDADGPYIEIMTGAYSNNQPDYSWCHPYFTKEATMFFMPLQGMSHVKESTLDAAVNFELSNDNKALVEVHSYAKFEGATVSLKNHGETFWSTKVTLNPSTPMKWSVDSPSGISYYDLSVEVLDKANRQLVSYQPEKKPNSPMPETVKPAKTPSEIETVEEVVFAGLRLEQIYNPSFSPLPYYEEAIKREPNNAFANVRIGSWYLKEGIFEKAEEHLQRAADRWTTDYTRSRDCESLYLLGLAELALEKETEAKDHFHRAAWDYTWYGASHLQLAMLESKNGNFRQAHDHIEKSLSVNVNNVRAHEIKLSLLRRMGRNTEAKSQMTTLRKLDPLNLYTYGEQLLLDKSNQQVLNEKMREEVQNYLDMGVKFGNMGMYKESIAILKQAADHSNPLVSMNALVHYYQGYYAQMLGNESMAKEAYRKASQLSVDYCFPFRTETEKVLKHVIQQNPSDDKAWYYWGNYLYDHQPKHAIVTWKKAIELNPKFAVAHRNLAFAMDNVENDPQKAKNHIALAIQHDSSVPNYYFEQDNYSLQIGESPSVRLQNLEKAGDLLNKYDNPLAQKVSLQLLCGKEKEALKTLQTHHFRKVEGVGNIHDTWIDAWLLSGQKNLASRNTQQAILDFEKTLEYPRNLDIGSNNREGQSHYFIGVALAKKGKKKLAKTHFEKAVNHRFPDEDSYYKGMAYRKLGNDEKADEVFKSLVTKGDERIQRIGETDFFSMFGDSKSANVRLAEAYALQGLGNWGLGKKDKAEAAFAKALKEDPSNFIVKTRLFEVGGD